MPWPTGFQGFLVSCMSKPSNGENEFKGTFIDFTKIKILKDEDHTFYTNKFPKPISACSNKDTDMIECCMNLPTLAKMQCLIKLEQIQQHKVHGTSLHARRK